MTKFIKDYKELTNKKELINLLNSQEVVFKETKLSKSKIEVLSIDNKELNKLTVGIGHSKGKLKLYYIENTILMLDNTFGWSGQGQPYTTTNILECLTKKDDKYEQLENNLIEEKKKLLKNRMSSKTDLSIKDIEKEIVRVYAPKIELNTQKRKYEDEYDFAINNTKLFIKYIKETFKDNVYFSNVKEFSIFQEDLNCNEIITKSEKLKNLRDLIEDISLFYSKINKNITHKVPKNMGIRQLLFLINDEGIKPLLKDINLTIEHYSEEIIERKPLMIFGLNLNDQKIKPFKKEYEEVSKTKENIVVSLKDDNLILDKERKYTKEEILNKLSNELLEDFTIYESDLEKLIKRLKS